MNNFPVFPRRNQPYLQPVSQGTSDLPQRNQPYTPPIPQDASDFGKVVSSDRNNNARVSDIGETHFSRRPIGRDPAGLQKFRVGLLTKSAISVDGQKKLVRFKGFGFENGARATINDKPLAIYQKGAFPNPFAGVYRIDLELQEKGLENFKGFPLTTFKEIKTPFNTVNHASYSVLYQNEAAHDNNFHTYWQKVRPSNPLRTLPRDPNVLMTTILHTHHRDRVQSRMAFYHAAEVKGVDLGKVQGSRDARGYRYRRDSVIVPGRVDTDKITKLSSYCSWVQEGDPNPVGVYKTWTFGLAPRVESRQATERLTADNVPVRQRLVSQNEQMALLGESRSTPQLSPR
jgi:hypothetical protein